MFVVRAGLIRAFGFDTRALGGLASGSGLGFRISALGFEASIGFGFRA